MSLGREKAVGVLLAGVRAHLRLNGPSHPVLSSRAFRMRFWEGDIWDSDCLIQGTEDCGLGTSRCHHFQPT